MGKETYPARSHSMVSRRPQVKLNVDQHVFQILSGVWDTGYC